MLNFFTEIINLTASLISDYNQMDSEEFHFKFKVAVLGDKHVGKSTLVDNLSTNHGQVLEVEVSEE